MIDLSITLKNLKIVVSTHAELVMSFNLLSHINGLCTFHCEMEDGVALQQVNSISDHQQLHKLIVIGGIKTKLGLILPCNLVMLELRDNIMYREDPMRIIGKMQHLKLLRMSNSYLGTIFTCKRRSFPQLEELYLANFQYLEEWNIQDGCMMCLKKMEILQCKKLRYFPKGLLFVTSLQELEYLRMHEEFNRQAREYGWSKSRFRLPHNYEHVIGQADFVVDSSSISKLYEQLVVGIYLKGNVEKYWVIKHCDSYYNCFMLYAEKLILRLHVPHRRRIIVDEIEHESQKENTESWRWSTMTEGDGTTGEHS